MHLQQKQSDARLTNTRGGLIVLDNITSLNDCIMASPSPAAAVSVNVRARQCLILTHEEMTRFLPTGPPVLQHEYNWVHCCLFPYRSVLQKRCQAVLDPNG